MKESSARLVVHITGLSLIVLLGIHGIFTLLGSVASNMEFERVYDLLHNQAYFLLLGVLLILSFVHAGAGLRRTLIAKQHKTYLVGMILLSVVFVYIFFLYLATVV